MYQRARNELTASGLPYELRARALPVRVGDDEHGQWQQLVSVRYRLPQLLQFPRLNPLRRTFEVSVPTDSTWSRAEASCSSAGIGSAGPGPAEASNRPRAHSDPRGGIAVRRGRTGPTTSLELRPGR